MTILQKNFTQEEDDDNHGHGTHCAGTIFGREVDNQRIGVAPGVNTALIGKVLGTGGGSSATLASAINWAADKGAHVISMSLGIDFPGFVDLGLISRKAILLSLRIVMIPIITGISYEGIKISDKFKMSCV